MFGSPWASDVAQFSSNNEVPEKARNTYQNIRRGEGGITTPKPLYREYRGTGIVYI